MIQLITDESQRVQSKPSEIRTETLTAEENWPQLETVSKVKSPLKPAAAATRINCAEG